MACATLSNSRRSARSSPLPATSSSGVSPALGAWQPHQAYASAFAATAEQGGSSSYVDDEEPEAASPCQTCPLQQRAVSGAPSGALAEVVNKMIKQASEPLPADAVYGAPAADAAPAFLPYRSDFSLVWPPCVPLGVSTSVEVRAEVAYEAVRGGHVAAVSPVPPSQAKLLVVREDAVLSEEDFKLKGGQGRIRIRVHESAPGVINFVAASASGVPTVEAFQTAAPLMSLAAPARDEVHRLLWKMMSEALPPNASQPAFDPDAFETAFDLLPARLQGPLSWAWANHFRAFVNDFNFLLECLPDDDGATTGSPSAEAEAEDQAFHYQSVLAQMVGFLRDNEMFTCLATLLHTAVARGLMLVHNGSVMQVQPGGYSEGLEAALAAAQAAGGSPAAMASVLALPTAANAVSGMAPLDLAAAAARALASPLPSAPPSPSPALPTHGSVPRAAANAAAGPVRRRRPSWLACLRGFEDPAMEHDYQGSRGASVPLPAGWTAAAAATLWMVVWLAAALAAYAAGGSNLTAVVTIVVTVMATTAEWPRSSAKGPAAAVPGGVAAAVRIGATVYGMASRVRLTGGSSVACVELLHMATSGLLQPPLQRRLSYSLLELLLLLLAVLVVNSGAHALVERAELAVGATAVVVVAAIMFRRDAASRRAFLAARPLA